MNKYKSGSATNIFAGLMMLIPAVIILINAAESFGGAKVFLQYALLICGIVYIFTFVENRRGYFRPGWILTQGFTQFFIGLSIFFLTEEQFSEERACITFGIWALVTAASQMSGGIQLKALEVRKWFLLVIESVLNLIWAFFLLVNPFESYEYIWFLAGMFMGCISIGTILEFFIHRR